MKKRNTYGEPDLIAAQNDQIAKQRALKDVRKDAMRRLPQMQPNVRLPGFGQPTLAPQCTTVMPGIMPQQQPQQGFDAPGTLADLMMNRRLKQKWA